MGVDFLKLFNQYIVYDKISFEARCAVPMEYEPDTRGPGFDYEQLLYRDMQRFRGGLVFKAHRLLYHSIRDLIYKLGSNQNYYTFTCMYCSQVSFCVVTFPALS